MRTEATLELFHAIADPPSAEARKLVVALGLEARVRFRNVVYEEVQRDFSVRGGRLTPAVWDGERLHEGLDDVRRILQHAR